MEFEQQFVKYLIGENVNSNQIKSIIESSHILKIDIFDKNEDAQSVADASEILYQPTHLLQPSTFTKGVKTTIVQIILYGRDDCIKECIDLIESAHDIFLLIPS